MIDSKCVPGLLAIRQNLTREVLILIPLRRDQETPPDVTIVRDCRNCHYGYRCFLRDFRWAVIGRRLEIGVSIIEVVREELHELPVIRRGLGPFFARRVVLVVVAVIPKDISLHFERQRVEVLRFEHLVPNVGISGVIRSAANIGDQLHDRIAIGLFQLDLQECGLLLQRLVFLCRFLCRLQPV